MKAAAQPIGAVSAVIAGRARGRHPAEGRHRRRRGRQGARQEPVVQMHHRFAPILSRSHQPDCDAIIICIGVELRM